MCEYVGLALSDVLYCEQVICLQPRQLNHAFRDILSLTKLEFESNIVKTYALSLLGVSFWG